MFGQRGWISKRTIMEGNHELMIDLNFNNVFINNKRFVK